MNICDGDFGVHRGEEVGAVRDVQSGGLMSGIVEAARCLDRLSGLKLVTRS